MAKKVSMWDLPMIGKDVTVFLSSGHKVDGTIIQVYDESILLDAKGVGTTLVMKNAIMVLQEAKQEEVGSDEGKNTDQ